MDLDLSALLQRALDDEQLLPGGGAPDATGAVEAVAVGAAAERHFAWLSGPDGWMLGRLVVPAEEGGALVAPGTVLPFSRSRPLRLLVVLAGEAAADPAADLERARERARLLADLRDRAGGAVLVEAVLTHLPGGLQAGDCAGAAGVDTICDHLRSLASILGLSGLRRLDLLLALPTAAAPVVLDGMAAFNRVVARMYSGTGGGPVARVGGQIPAGGNLSELARLIAGCRERGLPLRFAGAADGTVALGRLRAATLAHARGLSSQEVADLLAEVPGGAAARREGGTPSEVAARDVARARVELALSAGVGSFPEALEDLSRAGLVA